MLEARSILASRRLQKPSFKDLLETWPSFLPNAAGRRERVRYCASSERGRASESMRGVTGRQRPEGALRLQRRTALFSDASEAKGEPSPPPGGVPVSLAEAIRSHVSQAHPPAGQADQRISLPLASLRRSCSTRSSEPVRPALQGRLDFKTLQESAIVFGAPLRAGC